ncbi:dihydroneopterin aldolase [Pasteurellaceae bacterium Macca]|nr:dihydroneopterin aldolase [Pasteurellaceae bacterium Macca]
MKKALLFLPFMLLLSVVLFLVLQLKNPDNLSPSEDWRGRPFPEFQLPSLTDQRILTRNDLPKDAFIVNVWASWCTWCVKEFPALIKLKAQGVPIVGLTMSDHPDDARSALKQWGNPFTLILNDYDHAFLIQTLNINAAPASYLVDKQGIIRFQQKGYNPQLAEAFYHQWQALQEETK